MSPSGENKRGGETVQRHWRHFGRPPRSADYFIHYQDKLVILVITAAAPLCFHDGHFDLNRVGLRSRGWGLVTAQRCFFCLFVSIGKWAAATLIGGGGGHLYGGQQPEQCEVKAAGRSGVKTSLFYRLSVRKDTDQSSTNFTVFRRLR